MITGVICHFWIIYPILSRLYGISASHRKEIVFYDRNNDFDVIN